MPKAFAVCHALALAITLCGTAAAQAIAPPLANWLIEAYGWRQAYVLLGLGWGAVALLLCWPFLYDLRDRRLDPVDEEMPRPEGDPRRAVAAQRALDRGEQAHLRRLAERARERRTRGAGSIARTARTALLERADGPRVHAAARTYGNGCAESRQRGRPALPPRMLSPSQLARPVPSSASGS